RDEPFSGLGHDVLVIALALAALAALVVLVLIALGHLLFLGRLLLLAGCGSGGALRLNNPHDFSQQFGRSALQNDLIEAMPNKRFLQTVDAATALVRRWRFNLGVEVHVALCVLV